MKARAFLVLALCLRALDARADVLPMTSDLRDTFGGVGLLVSYASPNTKQPGYHDPIVVSGIFLDVQFFDAFQSGIIGDMRIGFGCDWIEISGGGGPCSGSEGVMILEGRGDVGYGIPVGGFTLGAMLGGRLAAFSLTGHADFPLTLVVARPLWRNSIAMLRIEPFSIQPWQRPVFAFLAPLSVQLALKLDHLWLGLEAQHSASDIDNSTGVGGTELVARLGWSF